MKQYFIKTTVILAVAISVLAGVFTLAQSPAQQKKHYFPEQEIMLFLMRYSRFYLMFKVTARS